MSLRARFDENDWCDHPGWATHHKRPMFRFRLRCWLGHHVLPAAPTPADGHSPSNCARCPRCRAFLGWYVDGQHRHGSISRYFASLQTGGE